MPQNNPPQPSVITLVDQIKINEVMIIQYTSKIAELNAAIAAITAENVALNIQLKIANPNLPTE